MKMLSSSAQTLPLYVGKLGEKPPPLCGAIPADPNYIAKVGIWFIFPLVLRTNSQLTFVLLKIFCMIKRFIQN